MNKRGIINTIVLIVVALIILGYYKIDIKSILAQPLVQSNLDYLKESVIRVLQDAWVYLFNLVQTYLKV